MNTGDRGAGSLRQALLDNNSASGGTNRIEFDLPGPGVLTIATLTTLPAATVPVVIDGFTQPGSHANTLLRGDDAVLRVRIAGSDNAGTGLALRADGCVVRGVVIVQCPFAGVLFQAGAGSAVEGCSIGLEADGDTPAGNGYGVLVASAAGGCRIGGGTPAARNIISANLYTGVELSLRSGQLIQGNYIGCDATGLLARGNSGSGIHGSQSHFNQIGGTNALERNVICANGAAGFAVRDGINLVQCHSNQVLGNFVGVNAAGAAGLGNADNGISLGDGFANTIGGAAPGAGNVISGNQFLGVLVYGATAAGHVIQGNRIGPAADGMSAIANAGIGIWLTSGSGTLIGGAAAGEGNQISGNASHGIAISQAAGSRIHGNLIGTDASGTGPLGNGQNGVNVDSSGHTVGGAGAGQGNVIAFNGISGVGVGFGNGNALRANSIHSNLRMGIDLYPFAGPTANDDGDEDAGGNDLQNSPILTRAVLTPTNVLVRGTFNSRPNIDYVLDFYAKPTCDSSGLGQGRSWLGATRVTTDVAGNALFNASVGAVPGASVLAATATDANGSTSEFSWCLPINTNGIADLVLTRTVSAGSVLAGQPITYVLTVSNAGPHSADNVWLSLWLTASGLTGCSAEVSQGTVGPDGDSWYASLGPIAVGGSATLRLTVIPTDIQTILDYGTVLLDQYDPEPGNNSTSGSVTSAPGPGVLEFSAARFVARESGGVAAISVTRRGGDAGPVSVDYATSDLTAVGGLDYIAAAGTLVFASGEVAKTFTVLIQDDALPECNKELLLTLLHPAGGAVVLGQTSATLAIVDDEVGPRRSLELVSVDTNSPPRAGNGHSSEGVASSSGEFVAFSSLARNLSASGGSAFVQNVFVRDRVHHTTRLISASTNGTGGASGSSSPRISGDGRFVAFASRAPDLVAGDVNDGTDIFLRDVLLETTRLVSVNRAGSGSANAPSYEPEMTPDGRFVVFESPATDLASNDSNGAKHDIYLRDMTQPAAELISLNSAGTGSGDGDSFQPAVSADGRYVVFQSFASNLAGTGGGWPQIYLRDRAAGSNILCSVESNHAGGGNGYSSGAALSAQGQVVAFQSDATDMVAGDTNDTRDVFIFDARSREVGLVSMNASGSGSGNGGSYSPVLSADGRYVAFFSYATDLVAGLLPGSTGQVFVRDLLAGTTALVSVNCDGTGGGNADSEFPSISADGRFVAFRSSASDLVSGEFPPSSANVYRRDLVSGSTVLVSRSQDGSGGGGSYSLRASVSPDGGTVTFDSLAPDLVSNDGNGEGDVFVWQAASAGAPDINAVISLRRIAGGALTVAVAGRPGGAYRLQRTTSLATSGLWSSLVTTNAPADGRFEFLDPAPPPSSAFYRVLRQ